MTSLPSSQQKLLIATVALLVVACWPTFCGHDRRKTTFAADKPPALESNHGAEGEEHSQEGAIEVSDETAELVGIKTEDAIKGVFLVLAVVGWATLWMAVAADMGASLLVIANGLRALHIRDQNARLTRDISA